MNKFIINNLEFSKNSPETLVIAEIGNNHQGDLNLCIEMIKQAKNANCRFVKLQSRNNKKLYTDSFYNSEYNSENAFADTYGEHRDKLELTSDSLKKIKSYCSDNNLSLIVTPFDEDSLDLCVEIDVDAIKVSSGDFSSNFEFTSSVIKSKKPVIISTGGCDYNYIISSFNKLYEYNQNISILQCTASYPTLAQDLNLNVIKRMNRDLNCVIGLSDHFVGLSSCLIAYMLGARIFEKHFTTSRALKGTDQSFSIEPKGLANLIRDLKLIPTFMGSSEKKLLDIEKKPLFKMQKSLVAKNDLAAGTILTERHLTKKSPYINGAFHPNDYLKIINRQLTHDINKNEIILDSHFK